MDGTAFEDASVHGNPGYVWSDHNSYVSTLCGIIRHHLIAFWPTFFIRDVGVSVDLAPKVKVQGRP